ncbi:hypothetical protein HNV11_08265 [Spirosoma taeanense]|uniref:Uncharacterized protein n=1 Tax=Spirosoma taeanense TaxID=2735870 RepID=A0A6M5Y4B4_9BACT|nr:hypothetical protein [Spirosoma taeanense]QJW89378.1 hypothetical protein HNV11_08265 [Spirosoma taeanense]
MPLFHQLLLAAGSMLLGHSATAQRVEPPTNLRDFSEQRIRHQKTLGFALGGYALANIAIGSIAAPQTTGETRSIHRMNVYWNLVNLGIAGIGLLGARNRGGDETLAQAVREHEKMKQILLLNAGLDMAYVMGGLYLRERANIRPDKADQLRGYGKSIMGQGGFLLAFDLVNYFIFKRQGDKQEMQLISVATVGMGVVLPIK